MYGEQMVRMLRAVDLLSTPTGATKQQLADHLGVDKRTVERLLGLLQELNFPIYDEPDSLSGKKYWKLVDTYVMKLPNITLPDIRLTLAEIIALYLVKGEVQLFHGTEIEKLADSAFGKMSFFMPDGLSEQLEKIRTLFVPSSKFAKDYTGKEEIIDGLRRAMVEHKRCAAKYHSFSSGKMRDYLLDPLKFFENNGGLYVFAYITAYDRIRTLAVERIERLDVTNTCIIHNSFNPGTKSPCSQISTSIVGAKPWSSINCLDDVVMDMLLLSLTEWKAHATQQTNSYQ
jgi:predicted DNA-binding transcriptional regulator YafY